MGIIREVGYNASPTANRFHWSKAFVRGIKGPVGSGKSVACCFEIYNLACNQRPNKQGVRKTRTIIVRNTLPQLETTTIKTWHDWFPPGPQDKGGFGKFSGKPPFTHYVSFALDDKTLVENEVIFLALDKPEDVNKLLSLEASTLWINEAREVPKEILDAGTARVGRYPSAKDGGCTRPSIIMDTNPPDDSHWWFNFSEEDTPEGWEFFDQPGGLDPNAENLENLLQPENHEKLTMEQRREHGRKYYQVISEGKTQEWVDVYVNGKYGFIKSGMPVYITSWNPKLHVAPEPIKVNPNGRLTLGIDSSGRHPATIILQISSRGQVQQVDELCVMEDIGMGAKRYAALLAQELQRRYPNCIIEDVWGDPAGGWGSQNDEQTYFDILRSEGIKVKESPGLRFPERKVAVEYYLCNLVDGQPAYLISPTCKYTIRGFNGGYQYRRISTSGDARYDESPLKNKFSNPHDALQYALCGIGGIRKVMGYNSAGVKTRTVNMDWSIYA